MLSELSAFIIGTIINIYLFNKYKEQYVVIGLFWEWILLILLLKHITKLKNKKDIISFIGQSILPIITYASLILFHTQHQYYIIIFGIFLLIWTLYSIKLYTIKKLKDKVHNYSMIFLTLLLFICVNKDNQKDYYAQVILLILFYIYLLTINKYPEWIIILILIIMSMSKHFF